MEQYVRSRFDPDYVPAAPKPFELSGFDWPYDQFNLFELWLKWEEDSYMPCEGDYFDQPPEWHQMIKTFRPIFSIMRHKVEIQVKARHPDNA